MTVDSFDYLIPILRPQRPLHQIGMFRWREKGEPVDPTMFANPVSDLHMIGMSVLGETGSLRLLRGEEALLAFSDLEEPPLSIAVMSEAYNTILQLNR